MGIAQCGELNLPAINVRPETVPDIADARHPGVRGPFSRLALRRILFTAPTVEPVEFPRRDIDGAVRQSGSNPLADVGILEQQVIILVSDDAERTPVHDHPLVNARTLRLE